MRAAAFMPRLVPRGKRR